MRRQSATALQPSLLPGGAHTALALGCLLVVWLITRVVLFAQMHDAAGFEIDALPEFLHGRRGDTLPGTTERAGGAPAAPATSVHVVLTSNGNSYMNWQTRVMYATYLAVVKREPGGPLARGAFTRVLHRSTDDELMQEVPTMRFTPAHVNCDVYCAFPVADRAPALVEWAATDDARRCSHYLLVETDHLFVKGLPDSLLPPEGEAVGFPFGYIVPTYPTVEPFARRFYPADLGPITDIPPTGNAPVLLTRADLLKIIPLWAQFVAEIEADDDAVEKLGWVRDMYAWSFAAARSRVRHILREPPNNPLMVQPPSDTSLGDAAILHYTWGPEIYNASNALVWQFDKRTYCGGQYAPGPRKLERVPEPPQWVEGLRLQSFFQGGAAVSQSGLELMRLEVKTFNEAVDTLPELPLGFTDRAAAERAALPSQEAQVLADQVQRAIAEKEEAKKRAQSGG